MNVVDSSAWLEYFANGQNATFFASAIEDTYELIVRTITVLEVFKRVLQQRGEGPALQAVALMQQGQLVELSSPIALGAAKLDIQHKLPLADSVAFATAQASEAAIWTQDADFEGLPTCGSGPSAPSNSRSVDRWIHVPESTNPPTHQYTLSSDARRSDSQVSILDHDRARLF